MSAAATILAIWLVVGLMSAPLIGEWLRHRDGGE
jgi:hypothetical protein